MPKPIAYVEHESIVKRHEGGESLAALARELARPYRSVSKVWQVYVHEGRIGANYAHCGCCGHIGFAPKIYRGALILKRRHPSWGAPLIRSLLGQHWTQEPLPTVRTLQRWFKQAGLSQRQHRQPPVVPQVGRGQGVHEVWALDSKQGMRLADGTEVCWLTLSEEKSGIVLAGTFFPLP